MSEPSAEVATLLNLPTLQPFINQLRALLQSPQSLAPPSIHIHAPSNSHLLELVLDYLLSTSSGSPSMAAVEPSVQSLLPAHASVDLTEVHSTRQSFDRMLNILAGWSAAGGEGTWDDSRGGVSNWDGRSEGVHVVQRAQGQQTRDKGKRRAVSQDMPTNNATKRPRRDSAGSDSSSARAHSPFASTSRSAQIGQEEEGTEQQLEWCLEWDRSLPPPYLAPNEQPLPGTPEHFLFSLGIIASLRSSAAPDPVPSSSAKAFAQAPRDPFASLTDLHTDLKRRYLVFNHAELLSELASAGTVGGAPKETGLGMTLEGVLRRAGELSGLPITTITISRLAMSKLRGEMVGLVEPVVLQWPDLSAPSPSSGLPDPVALLVSRFSSSLPASPSSQSSTPGLNPNGSALLTRTELLHLFTSLASLVYDLFGKYIGGDVEALGGLCARAWDEWRGVVERSRPPVAYTNTSALHNHLKAHFKRERDMIGLPPIATASLPTSGAPVDDSAPAAPAVPAPNAFAAALLASRAAAPTTAAPMPSGFLGSMPALPSRPVYLDERPADEEERGVGTSNSTSGLARPGAAGTSAPEDVFGPSPSSSAGSTPLRKSAVNLSPSSLSSSLSASTLSLSQRSSTTLSRSLPHLARWLLISAYYASFNPPKSDVKVFVRVDEGIARKGKKGRGGGRAGKKSMQGSPIKAKLTADLAGGKPFPLERMLAIFETLVVERLEVESWAQGDGVGGQIATLLSLRLLSRASSSNSADKLLDGVKLRCNVGREQVDVLARSVGFSEWKEMLVEGE